MNRSSNSLRFPGFLTVVLFSALMLFAVSCSDDEGGSTNPPSASLDASGTIGSAGGSISSSDGRLTLTVPANALATDTEIVFTEVTAADIEGTGDGLDLIYALTMEPEGLEFAQPAILELVYELGNDKRPSILGEHRMLITVASGEMDGVLTRTIPDLDVVISRSPQSMTGRATLTRGARYLGFGAPLYYVDGVPIYNTTVGSGIDVPGQVLEHLPFLAEGALELAPALELESDVTFKSEILEGYSTNLTDGLPLKIAVHVDEDGTTQIHFDAEYTAEEEANATLKFSMKYNMGLDLTLAFPEEDNRPTSAGTISVEHQIGEYSFTIEVDAETGQEIGPGTYSLSQALEGLSTIRGLDSHLFNNTLVGSAGNGGTIYSLSSNDQAAPVYTDLQIPGQPDWGNFPIYYRNSDPAEDSLAMVQFGPGGARLTPWLPDDQAFGWSQLLHFLNPVTDAQPFDGDIGSGGFTYVVGGFNQVHAIQYNTESDFYDSIRTINNFPGAPGSPFTAAVRSGDGMVVVTEGNPGKIYYHDLEDTSAPAVAIGDAGDSPRRIRTVGDLAFVSNFGSDNLTVLRWVYPGLVTVIGEVEVGDGPVGIDAMVLPDGNIGVVSAGFNDNTYTLTVFSPDGSLISNSTTSLPPGETDPGHVIWLRGGQTHFAVSINGTGNIVVVAALQE